MTMPRGPKGEKRPRGTNQLAKLMVNILTGEVEDREPTPEEQEDSSGSFTTIARSAQKGLAFRSASSIVSSDAARMMRGRPNRPFGFSRSGAPGNPPSLARTSWWSGGDSN